MIPQNLIEQHKHVVASLFIFLTPLISMISELSNNQANYFFLLFVQMTRNLKQIYHVRSCCSCLVSLVTVAVTWEQLQSSTVCYSGPSSSLCRRSTNLCSQVHMYYNVISALSERICFLMSLILAIQNFFSEPADDERCSVPFQQYLLLSCPCTNTTKDIYCLKKQLNKNNCMIHVCVSVKVCIII